MNGKKMLIVSFLFLFLGARIAIAQLSIQASADKTKIRIGEPVTMQLTAVPRIGGISFSQGFNLPDSIAHFEIWNISAKHIAKDSIRQSFTLTSYDSGIQTIPSFVLEYNAGSTVMHDTTKPIDIMVVPVNVDTLADYHDIKDIIEIVPATQWGYILAVIAIVAIMLAGIVYWIARRKRRKTGSFNTVGESDPYRKALEALEQLEKDMLSGLMSGKDFFTRLFNIYHSFLQSAYGVRINEQTEAMFISYMQSLFSEHLFYLFLDVMKLGSKVKFAKYESSKTEWAQSIQTTKDMLLHLQRKKDPAGLI